MGARYPMRRVGTVSKYDPLRAGAQPPGNLSERDGAVAGARYARALRDQNPACDCGKVEYRSKAPHAINCAIRLSQVRVLS